MPEARFQKGKQYSRSEVADIIGLPANRRHGGNWSTGYDTYDDEAFIFCNVGDAGRTGHDYANEWVGDQLIWYGKTGTHRAQPLIRKLIGGDMPVHVFWRSSNRDAFTYAGTGTAAGVEDTIPVRVRWHFA